MKLSKLILIIGIVFYTTQTYSQQIANTTWQINNLNGGPTVGYYKFSTDTVYGSPNNMNYNPVEVFTEAGNIFKITYLALQPCLGATGEYTFITTNNTLSFTITNDPCTFRSTFFTNVAWVKVITTGISSQSNQEVLRPVYPNPTSGILHIPTSTELEGEAFSIISQTGQTLYEGELKNEKQSIDFSRFSNGVYHLKTRNGALQKIIKL